MFLQNVLFLGELWIVMLTVFVLWANTSHILSLFLSFFFFMEGQRTQGLKTVVVELKWAWNGYFSFEWLLTCIWGFSIGFRKLKFLWPITGGSVGSVRALGSRVGCLLLLPVLGLEAYWIRDVGSDCRTDRIVSALGKSRLHYMVLEVLLI